MTGEIQQIETPGTPGHSLASPEFFHYLAGVRTLIWATLALVTGAPGLAATVTMR